VIYVPEALARTPDNRRPRARSTPRSPPRTQAPLHLEVDAVARPGTLYRHAPTVATQARSVLRPNGAELPSVLNPRSRQLRASSRRRPRAGHARPARSPPDPTHLGRPMIAALVGSRVPDSCRIRGYQQQTRHQRRLKVARSRDRFGPAGYRPATVYRTVDEALSSRRRPAKGRLWMHPTCCRGRGLP
jgi:hypothetical protein